MSKPSDDLDVYVEVLICWNCGKPNHVRIPRGTSIEHYKRYHNCTNCGCVLSRKEVERFSHED